MNNVICMSPVNSELSAPESDVFAMIECIVASVEKFGLDRFAIALITENYNQPKVA